MSALYLHVPFCRNKCHYCSFVSTAGCAGLFVPYVSALKRELSSLATESVQPLESIFIGGGTPTVLSAEMLVELLDHCHTIFFLAATAEISVEANPGTVDQDYLAALSLAGVNRLSLGVQSFADRDLQVLGRIHSAEEAQAAVRAARGAGIGNLNLDLMCGLPGQTVASWAETLDRALSLTPEHLSVYQLTIEQETPFADLLTRGRLTLPDEEEILEMDQRTIDRCREAGFIRYEISNFARPGFECRHNINYWENGEYYGCGVSAVSYITGVREKRIENVREYIERMAAGSPVVAERERLTSEASFRETVIMGLRMVRGVSRTDLRRRYRRDVEEYYGQTLADLRALGLVEMTPSHLRLTDRGRQLANRVLAELV